MGAWHSGGDSGSVIGSALVRDSLGIVKLYLPTREALISPSSDLTRHTAKRAASGFIDICVISCASNQVKVVDRMPAGAS